MMIDVQKYLYRLRDINELIMGVADEIELWKVIATKTTAQVQTVNIGGELHAVEKVQSSGSGDSMAEAVCKYVDLEAELGAETAALIEERQSIIATIKKLPAREYRLIRLMYVGTVARSGEIVYMSLKQTAAEMGISRRTATGIHGSALDRLRKILKEDAGDNDVPF